MCPYARMCRCGARLSLPAFRPLRLLRRDRRSAPAIISSSVRSSRRCRLACASPGGRRRRKRRPDPRCSAIRSSCRWSQGRKRLARRHHRRLSPDNRRRRDVPARAAASTSILNLTLADRASACFQTHVAELPRAMRSSSCLRHDPRAPATPVPARPSVRSTRARRVSPSAVRSRVAAP